ncbi:MAG: alanine--tRNA ligase [Candidatus Marinimicrobia bacterium]|jgi:alanyl-tRNA synthetase|nr:alanine--tRNA ligase [Candidatus Neomarinimicrobiota bacterium]MDP6611022.1 alanine--tRNA ligase [Candidatus Neomarinimicrobiota bacterium]|tara:strand:- start:738 stop:3323 length:2586 start_codon:yes stop_codon:yes gene_type:complete
MKSQDIRNAFIDFFKEKDHRFVRSSPVVPIDDQTLLFTNAGMNQFKPIFLGQKDADHPRAVNSQKCIRVSGKHNDLEEVGVDTFHHTFFEMLGNWSFGDYYKAEAIQWAWELFTEVWGLDKNRLWATVYHEDDEAFDLWPKVTDIDSSRVLKCGKKDNFWEMGETGPCGPCSEIHYFIGDDPGKQNAEGVNVSDAYWELWNLVFIQNNRLPDGHLEQLPAKHVDTGAGFERIVSIMQNTYNNYTTDLFMPIIKKTEELTGGSYGDNLIPFQVIADHIRMLSFSIADGGLPGNEGRGYVLRRILRRAARFGRMLDQHQPFIYSLVESLGDVMGDIFPEVVEKRSHIEKVIKAEETSFNDTLDRGLIHFDKLLKTVSGKIISGKAAFRLYDTYGFPLDLTQLMARENGLRVDEEGFNAEMTEQKKRAKAAGKFTTESKDLLWKIVSEGDDSEFMGYETLSTKSEIRRYAVQDSQIMVILDQTPFYAESGGQIGDTGMIKGDGIDLTVNDVKKNNDSFIHFCTGSIKEKAGGKVECQVDGEQRENIRKNHTATHLMHQALKLVLGDHVHQAGSLVHSDYLRFDLTHFEKLNPGQIREIETIINREVLVNNDLNVSVKSFDDAKKEGAVAMFGEKYGNHVRVVTVADFSKELCGGTHVDRTGDIGFFKIMEESSLAAGVRRIVAVTGPKAVEYVQTQAAALEAVQSQLNCGTDMVVERVDQLLTQKKELEKELKQRRKTGAAFNVKALVDSGEKVGDYSVVVQMTDAGSLDELKDLGDTLLGGLKSGVGVLGADGDKPMAVVVVSQNLVKAGIKAGALAKGIGAEMGGGGGGKPHLATAGGKDSEGLKSAMDKSFEIVEKAITGL